jgi:hypothetical protein
MLPYADVCCRMLPYAELAPLDDSDPKYVTLKWYAAVC